jgi:hypothetical protein
MPPDSQALDPRNGTLGGQCDGVAMRGASQIACPEVERCSPPRFPRRSLRDIKNRGSTRENDPAPGAKGNFTTGLTGGAAMLPRGNLAATVGMQPSTKTMRRRWATVREEEIARRASKPSEFGTSSRSSCPRWRASGRSPAEIGGSCTQFGHGVSCGTETPPHRIMVRNDVAQQNKFHSPTS